MSDLSITTLQAHPGKAVTTKTTFSRETAVSINIEAKPAVVWRLLTNAADIPRWNSTIVSLTGNIEVGATIHLTSTLDDSRTFKLEIREMEPERRLVWGDRQGARTFRLEAQGETAVTFTMNEKIGGLFFPLYAKQIPPFDASFEQFAADLKHEAEAKQKSNNQSEKRKV